MKIYEQKELEQIIETYHRDGNEETALNFHGGVVNNRDLSWQDLRNADFSHISDRNLKLVGADISGANFSHANLKGSDMRKCIARGTDFTGAILDDTLATGAEFTNCDFSRASFVGAQLTDTAHDRYVPMVCPAEGSFIGYKKAGGHIVKLYIPDNAKRLSGSDRRCRTNLALVLSITTLDGEETGIQEVKSDIGNMIYRVGQHVVVNEWDNNRFHDHVPGIWFFIDRMEAVLY